jgi:hypothetical protein
MTLDSARPRRKRGTIPAWRSPPALLAIAVLVFYWPLVFAGRSFFLKDAQLVVYPVRLALRQRLLAFELPQWLPQLDLGMPLLANPSNGVLYPLNALLLLPAPWCVGVFVVSHSVLAAVGAFYLLRALRVRAVASALGALGFACGGYMVSLTSISNYMMSLAWLPLVGFLALRSWRSGRLSDAALTGLVLAVQITCGEPQGVMLTGWFVLALALSVPTSWQRRGRALALFALALVVALCLAMPQILPALELIPRSRRAGGIDLVEASHWSLHPLQLLELFAPGLFGSPFDFDRYLGFFMNDEGGAVHRDPWLASPYLGSLSIALAAFAIARPRGRHKSWTRGLTVLLGFGLCLALGSHTPLFGLYFDAVPGAQLFRYPAKFFGLCAVLLPMLAAAGADAWLDEPRLRGSQVAALAALPLALLVGFACSGVGGSALERLRPEATALHAAATLRWALASELCLFLLSALVLCSIYRVRRGFLPIALLLLSTLQIARANLSAYQTVPNDVYNEPPLARELRKLTPKGGVTRVMQGVDQLGLADLDAAPPAVRARALTGSLMMDLGIAYGIGYARSYISSEEGPKYAFWSQLGPFQRQMLDVFGIRFLLLPSSRQIAADPALREVPGHEGLGVHLFENRSALPFAYPVPTVAAVDTLAQAMLAIRDPRVEGGQLAIVDREAGSLNALDSTITGNASTEAGQCERVAPLSDAIDITCTLKRPSFVIVNVSHHPNWSAWVGDNPAPIARGNALVMGVRVPSGRQHLHLEYAEPSLPIALAVSLFTVFIVLLLVYRERRAARAEE